ncbi:unnamed protein product [Rotaria socialis]
MDVNDTDEIRSNGKSVSNLWEHMTKQENGKPQCKICNKLQSRQSGATSGLRKHLFQAHKMESFCVTSENPPSKSYQISTEEKKKIDSLTINRIVQDGRGFDDMRRPEMLKVFKHLAPGVAHRLHLVVCSGLGIWIRKNPTSSSSDTPTTSNIDAISNGDLNNIDSDKEDYTDKIQLNPGSSSLDESSQTSDNLLNKNVHPNVTVNEIFVNDEPDNLSIDITDNWSIDVIEELDARTDEIVQQDIGVLMKKSRSIVKLTSPPFS